MLIKINKKFKVDHKILIGGKPPGGYFIEFLVACVHECGCAHACLCLHVYVYAYNYTDIRTRKAKREIMT